MQNIVFGIIIMGGLEISMIRFFLDRCKKLCEEGQILIL
jgi:hypothetical protein